MSLNSANLIALGVSRYALANDAELGIYAGCVAAVLVMTHWHTSPVTHTVAKKTVRSVAIRAGIPETDYDDKAGAIFKCAAKMATKMAEFPALVLVRDSADDATALENMRDVFSTLGLSCRHYFKMWSNSPSTDKFDMEAIKAAKAEAKRVADQAVIDAALAMQSNISTSSLATFQDQATVEVAMTPVQRFALMAAAMSDQAEIDAFHAVLSARQAELRAIADAATATMPAPVPGEAARPSRGQRAKARREAVAA